MQNIKNSIKSFESVPDTAFFGKNVGRICNRLYNYLILFLIVGVIGALIAQPLLCLIASSVCFALGITVFFWFPGLMMLGTAFQWLAYDFDCHELKYHNEYDSVRYAPLILIHVRLCFYGIWQLVMSLVYTFGLGPLIVVLWFLFSLVRFIIRSLYDCLTFLIVCCFARVPIRENSMAWRIKGPGVGSVVQYKKIQNDDVYILLQAELEKIELQVFERRILDKLDQPLVAARNFYDKVFRGFQVNRTDSFSRIQSSISAIKSCLS